MSKIIVSATGCSLVDLLYSNIDFSGEVFNRYRSRSPGDGGLLPGALVFAEEIERFAGREFHAILAELTDGAEPSSLNLGGPAVVAAINAAQLLQGRADVEIEFSGAVGRDRNAEFIRQAIEGSGLATNRLKSVDRDSPVTYVLSDPRFNEGQGERTFINDIGAAWEFRPEDLDQRFFGGDILFFGGTGLVPRLHDGLTELLARGKALGRTTVVTTVYDFRNEKRDPRSPWPLGSSRESYRSIDLLIADRQEAVRLSGTSSIEEALRFFTEAGVGASVVTDGSNPVHYTSNGSLFSRCHGTLPVSSEVGARLKQATGQGDTTGCGDNFAGGVIASLARQMSRRPAEPDLVAACALGVACGGFACFYLGGTFHERWNGEKRESITPLYRAYCEQVRLEAEGW